MPGHSPAFPQSRPAGSTDSNQPVRPTPIIVSIAVGAIVHFDRLFRGAKPPLAGYYGGNLSATSASKMWFETYPGSP
jgi:hypothetical protein